MTKDTALQKKPRKERKENADKRRQQLLDATLRSIATNGLAKTTLATVANEAGLSQGVAVFYFKSKTGLLTGAMREHYRRYYESWNRSLDQAGSDPVDRLVALVSADFSPEVCNPEVLSVWYAFWGEQKFTPQYAEVSEEFEADRTDAIRDLCAQLLPAADRSDADEIADWIDTLTDGFWHHLHVLPGRSRREDCVRETLKLVAKLLPDHADAIHSRL